MPCEMVAQSPRWPQTLFPPVFPGLLGILGAPAAGISCQNIAGTTWYKTTKDQTQGTVGQASRQAATVNVQRVATPSTPCCVPKTSHVSATQLFLPSLSFCEREIQSSTGCKRPTGSCGVTWGGTDTLTGHGEHSKEKLLKLNYTLNLAGTRASLYSRHRLFVFDILLCSLSNLSLKTPV